MLLDSVRHAEYFVDPALSFADGWNQIYSYMVSLPAEIVAAAVIVDFWTNDVNNAVWITIFGLLILASNVFVGLIPSQGRCVRRKRP